MNVFVNPLPFADAGEDTSICAGNTVELNGQGTGVVQWSPVGMGGNVLNPQVSPTVSTTYTIQITDTNNCKNNAQVTVFVHPQIPTPIISWDGLELATVVGFSYQWFVNGALVQAANQHTLQPSISGVYEVLVTDNFGCSYLSHPFNLTSLSVHEFRPNEVQLSYLGAGQYSFSSFRPTKIVAHLYNVVGQKVGTFSGVSILKIDMAGNAAGVYILEIENVKHKQVFKISKSK